MHKTPSAHSPSGRGTSPREASPWDKYEDKYFVCGFSLPLVGFGGGRRGSGVVATEGSVESLPLALLGDDVRGRMSESAWSLLYTTESIPFEKLKSGKIAVKVINHYGDEVLKVFEV